jgi:hypothetical protein
VTVATFVVLTLIALFGLAEVERRNSWSAAALAIAAVAGLVVLAVAR